MLEDRKLHPCWPPSAWTAVGRRFSEIRRGVGRRHWHCARSTQRETSLQLAKQHFVGSMASGGGRGTGCGGGQSKQLIATFASIPTSMAGRGLPYASLSVGARMRIRTPYAWFGSKLLSQ